MAITSDSIVKVDEWNMKVKVDNKMLCEQLQDLTNSDDVIIYSNPETKQATAWEVVFDKLYAPDVRKWIKGLR
tara:strand:- start:161 stop:379 length:219 start_codon:yes stop_codon:yes gene_type:complete